MKIPFVALALVLVGSVSGSVRAAAPTTPRLTKKQDVFFIENDFVYRRFLQLARDGTYRQINRDRAAVEVDRGTWEQTADGTVLLHFTRGGLRFHALSSGPLSITLDDPQKLAALPVAAGAIRVCCRKRVERRQKDGQHTETRWDGDDRLYAGAKLLQLPRLLAAS